MHRVRAAAFGLAFLTLSPTSDHSVDSYRQEVFREAFQLKGRTFNFKQFTRYVMQGDDVVYAGTVRTIEHESPDLELMLTFYRAPNTEKIHTLFIQEGEYVCAFPDSKRMNPCHPLEVGSAVDLEAYAIRVLGESIPKLL